MAGERRPAATQPHDEPGQHFSPASNHWPARGIRQHEINELTGPQPRRALEVDALLGLFEQPDIATNLHSTRCHSSLHIRVAGSYRRIRVRPVTPAMRTAYCAPPAERMKSDPAVHVPPEEKLAISLRPKRTASAEPVSPSGSRIKGSTAMRMPGNSTDSSGGPSTQRS